MQCTFEKVNDIVTFQQKLDQMKNSFISFYVSGNIGVGRKLILSCIIGNAFVNNWMLN